MKSRWESFVLALFMAPVMVTASILMRRDASWLEIVGWSAVAGVISGILMPAGDTWRSVTNKGKESDA